MKWTFRQPRGLSPARPSGQRGAVLLEVLVALAILGLVGAAAAWRAAEWLGTVRRAHEAEANVRSAQRLMTAVSLWPRDDLDRHLGTTAEGPLVLVVARASDDLYAVAVRDTASDAVLLRTTLYRDPEP